MLYDSLLPRVYNLARPHRRPAPVDDLTAQTFENVLRNITLPAGEKAPFSSFWCAIARNALNDHLRAARRQVALPGSLSPSSLRSVQS
jgi:DNA-directed RNA polymerase specialized sigma24 family protein